MNIVSDLTARAALETQLLALQSVRARTQRLAAPLPQPDFRWTWQGLAQAQCAANLSELLALSAKALAALTAAEHSTRRAIATLESRV